jgi:hypothetical protein
MRLGLAIGCALVCTMSFALSSAYALAPTLAEEYATDVTATSATLKDIVNPHGKDTTYQFEYGATAAYGTSAPVPAGEAGAGTAETAVGVPIQGLSPGSTYHYRLVLTNAEGHAEGADKTFVTQGIGGKLELPDARQWELVSPANKHGALFSPDGSQPFRRPVQAAKAGGAIVYAANLPTEAEPPGNPNVIQVLSTRGVSGWSSRDIAGAHEAATGSPAAHGIPPEFQLFSNDLLGGLAFPISQDKTLLSSAASEPTPYVRNEPLCENPATAGECYTPLLTGEDVQTGTHWGTAVEQREVLFEGASPDLRHVALLSTVALTAGSLNREELYEWTAPSSAKAVLGLVSMLPADEGGGPDSFGHVAVGPIQNKEWSGARHSISDDGSRVFWEAGDTGLNERRLYMRDLAKGETIRIDAQPGLGGTPEPQFQMANAEGTKVFFTDKQRLIAGAGTGGQSGDLYECEIVEEGGNDKCALTDLTPENGGHSAEVQNILPGASEDGSYVYFVADSVLSEVGAKNERGEMPTQGTCNLGVAASPTVTCNLYVSHDGTTTFIARLSNNDSEDWGGYAEKNIGLLQAEASGDGRYLAFMSLRPLTGYDNHDVATGEPAIEVYLYDAVTERLFCASCNPTGARPVAPEIAQMIANGQANLAAVQLGEGALLYSDQTRIAADVPPGDPLGAFRESLYQPRYVFGDGRLFFNSSDGLAPQDVNGTWDVYEFEPEGTNSGCTSDNPAFSETAGGCVSLISAGSSAEESGFLDASEGGKDAFFLTASQLAAQDVDSGVDVYDAHECTTSAPCVTPAVPPPPCDEGEACKGTPSPQPAIFGSPASATFAGTGNVVPNMKRVTSAQKLALALKACRKKPKRKRAACERQARTRYGATGARRAEKSTTKGKG